MREYPQVRLSYLLTKKEELYVSMDDLNTDDCLLVEDELEEIELEIAQLEYVLDDVQFIEDQKKDDELIGFSKFRV